jgi:peroxiredoxin (alkyl hydroperoxide reductase subunit C)
MFPTFAMPAVTGKEPQVSEVTSASYHGKWMVVFYWPMDFTFVCPTEIAEFGRNQSEFTRRGAELLGASTDTHYVHLAWRQQDASLAALPFPMLADYTRDLAQALGIIRADAGVALRATFIVDPEGVIRWVNVNDLSVGRSVAETLRVLDGLQTGELTPCGWQAGERTLSAA